MVKQQDVKYINCIGIATTFWFVRMVFGQIRDSDFGIHSTIAMYKYLWYSVVGWMRSVAINIVF